MRLKCQLEIVNHNVASQGLRGGSGKAAQATLFLARKPGDVIFLMYCTAKNKQGIKYKVHKNVKQIFGKCVSEGKATIRLCEPTVDLCVKKANPVDLKRILNCIKLAHNGESISGQMILSSMAPATSKQVEKVKTKLMITERKNYPVSTSFPSTLERLSVNGCQLMRIEGRIIKLKYLTSLNLSNNKIKTLPEQLGSMACLHELDISENELTCFPKELCNPESQLCKTMTCLNLSKNQIELLPENFGEFSQLWSLNLSHNRLKILPKQIGNLKKLTKFNASNNNLKFLPFSFTSLSLENLDLFMNQFTSEMLLPNLSEKRKIFNKPLALLELSARTIRQNKIFYDNYEYVPFILIKYLDKGKVCQCGGYCFIQFIQFFAHVNLQSITQSMCSLDASGRTTAPVQAVICSNKCFFKYVSKDLIL
uniref:PIF1/LRR1 pleckstrin homology domain-containing protein n=1 Tax=Ciona savignyi TaxID=51511 RepID=H2YRR4_CIOSA